MVIIETSLGPITLKLHDKETPITVKNFLGYVQDGFYNNTIFHRVIDNFMIQGGGFEPGLKQKSPRDSIENEADKAQSNRRGTIAMARTPDPHSASAQFFINVKDNPFLDYKSRTPDGWGYCVFGEVVDGMDVVDKIKSVSTGSVKGYDDVPLEDVFIEKVVYKEKAPE